MAAVSRHSPQSRPARHAHDFVFRRISIEGLEGEIRQVAADVKRLDCQLNEDKNGIRSYFKGIFTVRLWTYFTSQENFTQEFCLVNCCCLLFVVIVFVVVVVVVFVVVTVYLHFASSPNLHMFQAICKAVGTCCMFKLPGCWLLAAGCQDGTGTAICVCFTADKMVSSR
jgi:hypothetical protein